MLRSLALTLAMLSAAAMAQAPPQQELLQDTLPQAETAPPQPESPAEPAPAEAPMAPEPAAPAAPLVNPQAAAASSAQAEQKRFEQFRRDLVSLVALRADADLLVAAAELAYADSEDKGRPAALKSPSLIKRAQKFGPDIPFVWWVSTFLECGAKGTSCHGEAYR
jgi:hypothetical protein